MLQKILFLPTACYYGSGWVNTVEIGRDFSPSKPVLRRDLCLSISLYGLYVSVVVCVEGEGVGHQDQYPLDQDQGRRAHQVYTLSYFFISLCLFLFLARFSLPLTFG